MGQEHARSTGLPPTPDNGVAVEIGPFKGHLKFANYTNYRRGLLPAGLGAELNYTFVLNNLWCFMDPLMYRHFATPEAISEYIDPDPETVMRYALLINEVYEASGYGEKKETTEKKSNSKRGRSTASKSD